MWGIVRNTGNYISYFAFRTSYFSSSFTGEAKEGIIGAGDTEGSGFAVPPSGKLGAFGGAIAVFKAFAQAQGGAGVPHAGSLFKATDPAGGVSRATYALEVAFTELVEGIGIPGAGSNVKELHGALIIAGAATATHEALCQVHAGVGVSRSSQCLYIVTHCKRLGKDLM